MTKLLTFNEIRQINKDGKFYAVGDNGKKYEAAYNSEYKMIFFAIPSTVEILGYIKR